MIAWQMSSYRKNIQFPSEFLWHLKKEIMIFGDFRLFFATQAFFQENFLIKKPIWTQSGGRLPFVNAYIPDSFCVVKTCQYVHILSFKVWSKKWKGGVDLKNSATSSPGDGFGQTEGCLGACSTTTRSRAEIMRKACIKAVHFLVPDTF